MFLKGKDSYVLISLRPSIHFVANLKCNISNISFLSESVHFGGKQLHRNTFVPLAGCPLRVHVDPMEGLCRTGKAIDSRHCCFPLENLLQGFLSEWVKL